MATQIFIEECEWGGCYFNEVGATYCEWAMIPNEKGKALILNHFQNIVKILHFYGQLLNQELVVFEWIEC
jgi:hypothetical protein